MSGSGSKLIYIAGAFIAAVIIFSVSNFKNIIKLKEDKDYYREKTAMLDKKNAELKQKLEWIKTEDDYVKFIARERMGLVEPGEIKFYLKEE
ncbi:MAG: septum formation initiator family protein [Elusimicrobia bacterium]|jgi:cell division protein FtsB|nr:septum formation initiator family protein [Elusimicrobiota bacterium]